MRFQVFDATSNGSSAESCLSLYDVGNDVGNNVFKSPSILDMNKKMKSKCTCELEWRGVVDEKRQK